MSVPRMANTINAVAVAAGDAASVIVATKLKVQSMLVENTSFDVTAGQPAVSIGVGEDPKALLTWARFLGASVVHTDRRTEDVTLAVEGIKDGIAWRVIGGYSKKLTGDARNRFPGITVEWKRREIGGTRTSHGTITVGQLEVLIGHLGV